MTVNNFLITIGWFLACAVISYVIWLKQYSNYMIVGIVLGSIVFAPWGRILSLFRREHLS